MEQRQIGAGAQQLVRAAGLPCGDALEAFEEVGDGHLERLAELVQPPGADPVSVVLVFLDLLKDTLRADGGDYTKAAMRALRPPSQLAELRPVLGLSASSWHEWLDGGRDHRRIALGLCRN